MSTTLKKLFLPLIILFFLFSISGLASAQVPDLSLNIEASPESPAPNSPVEFSLVSYSLDINNSTVVWAVNGKQIQKGMGLKSIKINTGNAGEEMVISVLITTPDGVKYSKSISINPVLIDILWESEGYVPPFYEGRSLFTNQGALTVIAEPYFKTKAGVLINPDDLVYKWKKDQTVLGQYSGRGKRRITVDGNLLQKETVIKVEVTSLENKLVGEQTVSFEPLAEEVVLYENNPLYGVMWNNAITDSYTLKNNELEIVNAPYFFTRTDIEENNLNYIWLVGGKEYTDLVKKRNLVLKPREGTEGASTIFLEVNNDKHIMQQAKTSSIIRFNKSNPN
ncbi:MAG: hypothetical protein Q7R78_00465 [bacterium]|nr:hypothetical protein [bacterium]